VFKWFAPLLLFAGKPDVLFRILVAVLAGAILFFGVWLISNIALTFDTLKNPYIVAIYGVVLLCFFTLVGVVSWLRLRRLSAPAKISLPAGAPEIPLPNEIITKRADKISRQWDRHDHRPEPAARARVIPPPSVAPPLVPKSPARAVLVVTGPAYAGKTTLVAGLVQATSSIAADAGAIDADERHLNDAVAATETSDGVLFVVDQDLRAPEVAAIKRLTATGKPLYLVLNKSDQFNGSDRDAILVSIRAKLPAGFSAANVVSVAAAPSPVEREIEDARGRVRTELRRPAADLRALLNLLSRIFSSSPGRPLRFEADV
jgi:signal recognition particle receptor subunit beta